MPVKPRSLERVLAMQTFMAHLQIKVPALAFQPLMATVVAKSLAEFQHFTKVHLELYLADSKLHPFSSYKACG